MQTKTSSLKHLFLKHTRNKAHFLKWCRRDTFADLAQSVSMHQPSILVRASHKMVTWSYQLTGFWVFFSFLIVFFSSVFLFLTFILFLPLLLFPFTIHSFCSPCFFLLSLFLFYLFLSLFFLLSFPSLFFSATFLDTTSFPSDFLPLLFNLSFLFFILKFKKIHFSNFLLHFPIFSLCQVLHQFCILYTLFPLIFILFTPLSPLFVIFSLSYFLYIHPCISYTISPLSQSSLFLLPFSPSFIWLLYPSSVSILSHSLCLGLSFFNFQLFLLEGFQ